MAILMNLYVNTTRNMCKLIGDDSRRRSEARRTVKLFLAPRDASMSDAMVPDYMVSDSMVDRYLAIEPPVMRGTTEFDLIIEEIERSYVLGLFFSALSGAVVTTERLLNTARIRLHEHVSPKVKELWKKDSTNDWQPNINALLNWKYLSTELAEELPRVYEIRCRYLHSGVVSTVERDSLRAIRAAYHLLNEFIGFPARLFKLGDFCVECLNPGDPLVRAFYAPSAAT
jgi:hypothetical protein